MTAPTRMFDHLFEVIDAMSLGLALCLPHNDHRSLCSPRLLEDNLALLDARWWHRDIAPALSPLRVTLSGSLPKSRMLSRTHSSKPLVHESEIALLQSRCEPAERNQDGN